MAMIKKMSTKQLTKKSIKNISSNRTTVKRRSDTMDKIPSIRQSIRESIMENSESDEEKDLHIKILKTEDYYKDSADRDRFSLSSSDQSEFLKKMITNQVKVGIHNHDLKQRKTQ